MDLKYHIFCVLQWSVMQKTIFLTNSSPTSRIKRGNFGRDTLNPLAEWEEVESLKKQNALEIDLCLLENLFCVDSWEDQCTDSPQRRLETALGKVMALGPSGCAAGLVGKQENKWKTGQEAANEMGPWTHTDMPLFMGSGQWLEWHPGSLSACPMAMLFHLATRPVCT